MAGTERNEYRPRRARLDDDASAEQSDAEEIGTDDTATRGRAAPPESAPDLTDEAAGEPTDGRADEPADVPTDERSGEPADESVDVADEPVDVADEPVDVADEPGPAGPGPAEPAAEPTSGSGSADQTSVRPAVAAPEQARTAAPSEPEAGRPAQQRPRSTEQTIADARRAERLAELRRLRDTTPGQQPLPTRSDRPDVGRRDNIAEPVLRTGSNTRHGLVLAAVAVLVVAAVVVGYLVFGRSRGVPVAENTPAPSPSLSTSMVSSRTMLSPEIIGGVTKQTWQIKADQPARGTGAPVPACLTQSGDDAPPASQAMVRTLTTTGSGPSALHLAQAYRTPELATEAFALIAKALGECNLKGSYIQAGRVISGLGDQATGIVLEDPAKHAFRSLVADRTGRMVNVVDVTQKQQAPDIDKVADALGQVTNVQCPIAVGICASDPRITEGPPPIGGDQPGFLATADIPEPGTGTGTWGGLDPGSPADVVTSGCEDVSFEDLAADNRTARSYILTDNPKDMPKTFGLDEIILTLKSTSDAADQAKRIISNIRSCEDRLPTATVGGTDKVSGTGAGGTEVAGSVATVKQKVTDKKASRYRVGVVAAGDKLVYTFLPTSGDWDLTDEQWSILTVRAGERATQVR